RVKIRFLLLAAVAALAFSAASPAAPQTTGPTKKVVVLVLIDDRGISVSNWVQLETDSNGGAGSAPLQAMHGPVPRGDYLSFNVFNRGKKVHDFTILGNRTPPVKPGGTAHLFTGADTLGNFVD